MFSEDNTIINNPTTRTEMYNNFFMDVIKTLDVDRTLHAETTLDTHDPDEMATKKVQNPSKCSEDLSRRILR